MAVETWIYGNPETLYEGCVLDTYERNGYHDSDFYAVCWDEEKGMVVDVEYDTTRCGGGGWATIDISEENLRKVYRHYKDQAREIFDKSGNEKMAKTFGKGDTVCVIRGRKIPKGSVGRVFWMGEVFNNYSHRNEERVGVEFEDGRKFLPKEYVELINWEERLISGKERKRLIREAAINHLPIHVRQVFAKGGVA